MKKNNKKKYILILTGIVLIITLTTIGYFITNNKKQEDILKQEIINLSNKDILSDNYDIDIKTKGDYAYIEETIKNYYKAISDNTKIINKYLNDETLINILSADNLKKDGPKFKKSYKNLTETRENINKAMQTIIDLCKEETIKKLIDKNKISNYSYELYLDLMYTDEDLEEINNTKDEIQTVNNNLNTFLDKVETILSLLKNNSQYWFIKDNQLYIEKDSLVKEYNNLYKDLNNFTIKNFTNKNTNKTTKTTKTNI